MPLPQTRDQFKDYILRRLGAPVIRINVEDGQVEDRIDDALDFWCQYHYDGKSEVYLAHQITADDKTNRYVAIDSSITDIVEMLPLQTSIGSSSIFSLNYQFAQSDLLSSALSADSIVPLWMALTRVDFYQEILVGRKPLRFNVKLGKVFIDMDWNSMAVGDYIILHGYQKIDTDQYPAVWGDRWLLRYATALVKKMWGENVKKYDNVQMPGGVTFKGQVLWDEGVDEQEKLEQELMTNLSPVLPIFIG